MASRKRSSFGWRWPGSVCSHVDCTSSRTKETNCTERCSSGVSCTGRLTCVEAAPPPFPRNNGKKWRWKSSRRTSRTTAPPQPIGAPPPKPKPPPELPRRSSMSEEMPPGVQRMRWTPGGISSDIEDRRGSSGGGFGFGGGAPIGCGGAVVLLVLSLLFHRHFFALFEGNGGGGAPTQVSRPVEGTPEEHRSVQFVSFVLDDVQSTWEQTLPGYRHAKLDLFRDAIQSACGFAQSASGPFYCPEDEKVYIDLGFYDELRQRFGAPGDFAQAYVLAHEIGHHVQKVLGIEEKYLQARRANPGTA